MGPNTKQLLLVLDEIVTLLDEDGEAHWVTWLQESKRLIQASDFAGITKLMSAYGGMGSFNDLVICQREKDGKFYWADGYMEKNERLHDLMSQAYLLAKEIARNQSS